MIMFSLPKIGTLPKPQVWKIYHPKTTLPFYSRKISQKKLLKKKNRLTLHSPISHSWINLQTPPSQKSSLFNLSQGPYYRTEIKTDTQSFIDRYLVKMVRSYGITKRVVMLFFSILIWGVYVCMLKCANGSRSTKIYTYYSRYGRNNLNVLMSWCDDELLSRTFNDFARRLSYLEGVRYDCYFYNLTLPIQCCKSSLSQKHHIIACSILSKRIPTRHSTKQSKYLTKRDIKL